MARLLRLLTLCALVSACANEPSYQPASGSAVDAGTLPDGEPTPARPDFKRGDDDLTSQEPPGSNGQVLYERAATDDTAGPLAVADGASPASAEAPNGRTGPVEEADIYRIDGNRLFYFNTYRGLLIYDITDTERSKLQARVPVYGYPVEMFVQGSTVYALLRDALYLTQREGRLSFERHNVSQLVAIDVSDPTAPKVLETVDIEGELREGVSRKVENTIYVVSYVPQSYSWGWLAPNSATPEEAAYVYSYDISNPRDLRQVDKLQVFKGGSFWQQQDAADGLSSSSRIFNGVAIGATSNVLMVVENWSESSYVSVDDRCGGSYRSDQHAVVSLVDISDPSGAIRLHARFSTQGHLSDQFKQTYLYDDVSHKGTYLGIFARDEWSTANCSWTRVVRNTLESWDVSDGPNPVQLDALTFGKPDEGVRGSAFDSKRGMAYAITARQIDPLYAISFADPAHLTIRSAIDGLSGDMNVFRLVDQDRFLIGIGRDNSEACSGWADEGQRRPTQVAVSLIDVRNLDAIKLVQRQCVTVDNAEWVSSSVNWNLDQAHKMIGMHSDGRTNVVTVPISYGKKVDDQGSWWWYRWETAVGVLTWDSGASAPDALKNHATVIHPQGEVKRSIVFTHHGATGDRRTMINLSDTHLSLTDIESLDQPKPLQTIEVAPYHSELFRFGDYLVEQLGQVSWYGVNDGLSEFRVKRPVAGQPLDQAPVLASFSEGQVQRVTKVGDLLVLFRQAMDDEQNPLWQQSDALVYDLSRPESPRRGGMVRVPTQAPYYYFWCGADAYWGGYRFAGTNQWVALRDAIVFQSTLSQQFDSKTGNPILQQAFVTLDLRDPLEPVVRQKELALPAETTPLELVPDATDPSAFYLSSRTVLDAVSTDKDGTAPATELQRVAYGAQRWRLSGGVPVAQYTVSLKGRLVRAFAHASGLKLMLTREDQYDAVPLLGSDGAVLGSTWRPTATLHLFVEDEGLNGEPKAYLQDTARFPQLYLNGVVLDGSQLALSAQHDYYYYGYLGDRETDPVGQKLEDQSDELYLFDLDQLRFEQTFVGQLGAYGLQLMGAQQRQLFVNLPGDGILVLDTSSPSMPVARRFLRTLGWGTHIELFGPRAFIASGYFGIEELDLAANAL